MGLTIIRRELPPWAKPRSRRPAVWTLPDDFEHGDPLPRRWSPDEPEFLTSRERAIYRAALGARGGSTAIGYAINSAIFAMTSGAKTILNSIAPAGHGLALTEAAISFDGVTASAVPAYVEVCTSTQAGAGTGGTAPTIAQVRGRSTTGSAPTAAGSFTAEPTTLVRVRSWYISPNGGVFIYPLPLGREIESDSSAGSIKALAIRVNVTANVNAQAYTEVEAVG